MSEIHPIAYLIIFFGVISLLKMAIFLIGSDLYGLFRYLNKKKQPLAFLPNFSVVIPAHNEEQTIIRCICSVIYNGYPVDKLEVIVVDDGSTDKTYSLVKDYKNKYQIDNLKIIKQINAGKARALNNGMKKYAKGELIMCLDADSGLQYGALNKAASYFLDPKIMALAANVKIISDGSFLNLIQRFEYLICYQMKRAQTLLNIEYIIGGIGSTFRKSALKQINYYDTNTVTEDIDLTLKILKNGNKTHRVIYGSDVIAWTESVLTLPSLIKQRYRWKYGRYQTFLKNKDMFFNSSKNFTKGLTFFYLPFALFCDLAFLLEPLMVGYILYLVLVFKDIFTLFSAFLVISCYITFNILAEDTISWKDKIILVLIAPTMYFYFYILSFIEYIALIKSLINLKNLNKSLTEGKCNWQHVERSPKLLSTH